MILLTLEHLALVDVLQGVQEIDPALVALEDGFLCITSGGEMW
jgi:hypothetical protein